MAEKMSFEQALKQLEDSVARLEAGEVKLEEALQVFERGVKASRTCAEWLEHTRKRVQVLTAQEDGELRLDFLDEVEDEPETAPGPETADHT